MDAVAGALLAILVAILACQRAPVRDYAPLADILPPDGALLRLFLRDPAEDVDGRRVRIEALFSKHFRHLGWHFEADSFVDGPGGRFAAAREHHRTFTNLIATSNVRAPRRILLAAHYDVLDEAALLDAPPARGGAELPFQGALDAAWSCALLLHLAAGVDVTNDRLAIQIALFDGEEAITAWGPLDSLYGSRHMAAGLAAGPHPIVALLLFDLLGGARQRIYNFAHTGRHADPLFGRLLAAEAALGAEGRLLGGEGWATLQRHAEIAGRTATGAFTIEDDHVPFVGLAIPTLHLIPHPFPAEWHTARDNVTALDRTSCHDLALIVKTALPAIVADCAAGRVAQMHTPRLPERATKFRQI